LGRKGDRQQRQRVVHLVAHGNLESREVVGAEAALEGVRAKSAQRHGQPSESGTQGKEQSLHISSDYRMPNI